MCMGDAQLTVEFVVAMTALILMTDWMTATNKGLTVIAFPELITITVH